MWAKNVRYLDYNASSGVTVAVRKKLTELLSRTDLYFANPSSLHRLGQQTHQLLLRSEAKIASSLGEKVEASQLVFTASGTEANQTVIRSAMKNADLVIIGAGEHSASYDLCTTELPLLSSGQYDLESLKRLLSDAKQSGRSKVFLSIFWANNETGVLTPLKELEAILRSAGEGLTIILHLDGSQVWGKMEIDLFQTPAHFITFSGHKIGAPAGVGVIWIRPGSVLDPLITGAQENGLRGGTQNALGIAALAFAAEDLSPAKFSSHTASLRQKLEEGLQSLPVKIWGQNVPRISNTSRFSILGHENYGNWVERLDLAGFAVSHGSACKSKVIEPSRVLLKMGATKAEALNAIRISFGPDVQSTDVDDFLVAFRAILSEKRVLS